MGKFAITIKQRNALDEKIKNKMENILRGKTPIVMFAYQVASAVGEIAPKNKEMNPVAGYITKRGEISSTVRFTEGMKRPASIELPNHSFRPKPSLIMLYLKMTWNLFFGPKDGYV